MRQFVKFVIVGASSTFIDLGLNWLLFKAINGPLNTALRNGAYSLFPDLKGYVLIDPAFVIIKAFTFIVATFNGFYWNRKWTFRAVDPERKRHQLAKFYVVYVIALGINTIVASSIYHPHGGKYVYLLSLVVATIVTTMWTFPTNKFWTFKLSPK